MAQWLEVLAAFAEDSGLVLAPTVGDSWPLVTPASGDL